MPRKGTPRKPGVTPRYATPEQLAVLEPKRKHLNTTHIKFLELMAGGMSQIDAGMAAGLKSSNSRYRCLTNPLAIQYLSGIRAESRAIAAYDVSVAMAEALEDHRFAVQKGNAMAAVKATELRAKLSGLLIDRVEIATVDLTGALAKAEARVFNIPQAEPTSTAQAPLLGQIISTSIPN